MEITVEINDDLIDTVGFDIIKRKLDSFASRLELSLAAQDALAELAAIDLTNDPQWQAARLLAWEQEKHNVLSAATK